jgi:hypothetical protein
MEMLSCALATPVSAKDAADASIIFFMFGLPSWTVFCLMAPKSSRRVAGRKDLSVTPG